MLLKMQKEKPSESKMPMEELTKNGAFFILTKDQRLRLRD